MMDNNGSTWLNCDFVSKPTHYWNDYVLCTGLPYDFMNEWPKMAFREAAKADNASFSFNAKYTSMYISFLLLITLLL